MFNYPNAKVHPFGEHGILLALPLSAMLWTLIALIVF